MEVEDSNPNPNSQNKLPAPSTLVDRFLSMVQDRDEEMQNLNPNQFPPPLDSTEVVGFYEQLLEELRFNSKPIITELTILAGQQRAFAEGIADAICTRIAEVAPDQKLPSLYLLDSIVKNIGREYIRPFTARLPEVFIGAYNRVHPSQHTAMCHLFKTWSQVFPSNVLRKIEDALQFNMSSSSGAAQQQLVAGPVRQGHADSPVASPRPSHGIHVNLKYLDGQHQIKSSAEYGGDYDLPPRVGSTVNTHPTTFSQGALLPFPSRKNSSLPPPKPSSPIRVGIRRSRSPPGDLYTDRPSTSHIFRNEYRVHNPNPRDLIDAYGGDNRKIQRLEKGREWKRSEEEEFVWEDMSPTFSDRVRRDQAERMGFYGNGSGLIGGRVGLDRPDLRPVEPKLRSWHAQGPVGAIEDRGYVLEERKSISSFGEAAYKRYQGSTASRTEPLPYHHPSSNHIHEPSKLSPYTGPTVMHTNHGAPHHVRPPHNPATMTRVMPPPLNAPRSLPIGPHESIHAPANSIRLLPPKAEYIRSGADTSFDANKPSLFVPSVSAGPVPVPVTGRVPHQQTLLTMHTQGVVAPPVTVGLVPPMTGVPQLLQRQLHAGGVSATPYSSSTVMPPLPPGPPPSLSVQVGPTAVPTAPVQPSGSAPVAFSGLLTTLMAQGLISLKPQQEASQEAVGLEFNLDLLKIRTESSINALYSDLARQCTTCGVRFRHQEEHSAHMDWHVTKNRVARNRKQKPSRRWYVSAKEWLRGAEMTGTDPLPAVPAVEIAKEEEAELAVPADDDQTTCALCGEQFENYYSHEREDWMYRGAIYLNGTDGSGVGAGTSPIVHAKCRPDSSL